MNGFESVRRFAISLEQEVGGDGLQVAIFQAGVIPGTYSVVNITGWESSLQANLLSTALLVTYFLPFPPQTRVKGKRASETTHPHR